MKRHSGTCISRFDRGGINALPDTSVRRRRVVLGGLASATLPAMPVFGQGRAGFPDGSLHIIVSAAAGGNLDVTMRALATRMADTLGASIVVENRAGGNSLPATRLVKDKPADGHTLLAMSNTFVISANFIANPGYDPLKDFAGIGMMNRLPMLLVTSAQKPIKSLSALIELARSRPGGVSFASSGIGTATHLPAAMLEQQAGIRMLHVPYKGNAPAIADVLSGRVDIIFDPISTAGPLVRDGRYTALGITTPGRSPLFPGVPTIAELGFPGFDFTVYTGLVAPAGTPRPVVARWHDALRRATSSADFRESFGQLGTELYTDATPEQFDAFLRNEVARYAKLVKEANIKPETL